MQAFVDFSLVLRLYTTLRNQRNKRQISCLLYLSRYFVEAYRLSAFNFFFFSTESSSFSVNCPSLMFSWISAIFCRFMSDFRRVSEHILKMLFLFSNSLFLASKGLFHPLISFTHCYANSDCLYSIEFLVLLVWPWTYSGCSFCYVFVLSGFSKVSWHWTLLGFFY